MKLYQLARALKAFEVDFHQAKFTVSDGNEQRRPYYFAKGSTRVAVGTSRDADLSGPEIDRILRLLGLPPNAVN